MTVGEAVASIPDVPVESVLNAVLVIGGVYLGGTLLVGALAFAVIRRVFKSL